MHFLAHQQILRYKQTRISLCGHTTWLLESKINTSFVVMSPNSTFIICFWSVQMLVQFVCWNDVLTIWAISRFCVRQWRPVCTLSWLFQTKKCLLSASSHRSAKWSNGKLQSAISCSWRHEKLHLAMTHNTQLNKRHSFFWTIYKSKPWPPVFISNLKGNLSFLLLKDIVSRICDAGTDCIHSLKVLKWRRMSVEILKKKRGMKVCSVCPSRNSSRGTCGFHPKWTNLSWRAEIVTSVTLMFPKSLVPKIKSLFRQKTWSTNFTTVNR